MVNQQLLIIFYKQEVKNNPSCIASKALLERSRKKLMEMKDEKI